MKVYIDIFSSQVIYLFIYLLFKLHEASRLWQWRRSKYTWKEIEQNSTSKEVPPTWTQYTCEKERNQTQTQIEAGKI